LEIKPRVYKPFQQQLKIYILWFTTPPILLTSKDK
jgi:hypothetical protein